MTVRLALIALLTLTACASNAPARPSLSAQARAHTELAEAYYQNAQYAVALTEVRAALSADSGFAPAHNLDGLLHMALGQTDLAEHAFNRALAVAPQDSDARNNRAVLLCHTGRPDRAVAEWRRVIADPLYATPDLARQNIALCLQASGRNEAIGGADTAQRRQNLTAGGAAFKVAP